MLKIAPDQYSVNLEKLGNVVVSKGIASCKLTGQFSIEDEIPLAV